MQSSGDDEVVCLTEVVKSPTADGCGSSNPEPGNHGRDGSFQAAVEKCLSCALLGCFSHAAFIVVCLLIDVCGGRRESLVQGERYFLTRVIAFASASSTLHSATDRVSSLHYCVRWVDKMHCGRIIPLRGYRRKIRQQCDLGC